jgi:hypothetical protein
VGETFPTAKFSGIGVVVRRLGSVLQSSMSSSYVLGQC